MSDVRVAIDATALPPDRGGVGRYLEGLLGGLDHPGVTVIAQPRDASDLAGAAASGRVVAAPAALRARPLRLLWEQLGLPRAVRSTGASVLHSPHYTFPLLTRTRRVVTLHDATFFSAPAWHGRLKRRFFRIWCRLAWRYADGIVVPSAATRSEFERFLGPRRGPVTVAHHGVDPAVFHPATPEAVGDAARRYGLDAERGWIAFLGTIEPRKNLPALLDAHAALRRRDPETPELVIVGQRGWDAVATARLDALGAEDGVRELGFVPLADLAPLLAGAAVVVYPSSGEGFGLPVLEAMAAGGVVLTTRALALPEVGGDVAVYAEPDAAPLADAIAALLADPAERARRARLGVARAAGFTWSRAAEAHVAAYREAAT